MALYPLLRPFAFALDAEAAHRATIRALKADARRQGGRAGPDARDHRRRRWISPIRSASPPASTRMREVYRQMLGFGFGFVEVGTLTPLAAGRQSEAAPVPARRGPRRDQPAGLQQSRPGGGAGAAGAARPAKRASSASISARTRTAPTGSPTMRPGVRAMLRRRRLSHRQHLLAQHAGPARACRTKARSTQLLAAVVEARGGDRPARFPEGRAGPRARPISTPSRASRSRGGSTR